MTNHMTPTEQDKELRDDITSILLYSELDIANDADAIMYLITADRRRVALEAAIMGAKFGNAAFRQYSIVNPGKSVNLDDIRQSGIEQATEWARRVYES